MISPPSARLRVAIVGSGVSGLVCASRLHEEHDVTVFESGGHVGGHVHTVDVEAPDGPHAIDTGFIVFNPRNYPLFTALLESLGVPSRETEMSFSVRSDAHGIEYKGSSSWSRLFVQRRNLVRPRFWGMLRDILRFPAEARAVLHGDDRLTVGDFLESTGFGRGFIEDYFVPLGSSLWSCGHGRLLSFPARFVVEFLDNHGMLDLRGRPVWRVVAGGSRTYVDALTAPFRDRIRVGLPVRAVTRTPHGVRIDLEGGASETFDEVIIACHADDALALLSNPTDTEQEVLESFPYERNEAVLHTDTSVLPRRRAAWSSWNYHVPETADDRARVTYDMNILQSLEARETYLVTLNDVSDIDPEKVIRRMSYSHPTWDVRRALAQSRHDELIRADRLSFCGAYWGYGFHEDGVRSAMRVSSAYERDSSHAELPV